MTNQNKNRDAYGPVAPGLTLGDVQRANDEAYGQGQATAYDSGSHPTGHSQLHGTGYEQAMSRKTGASIQQLRKEQAEAEAKERKRPRVVRSSNRRHPAGLPTWNDSNISELKKDLGEFLSEEAKEKEHGGKGKSTDVAHPPGGGQEIRNKEGKKIVAHDDSNREEIGQANLRRIKAGLSPSLRSTIRTPWTSKKPGSKPILPKGMEKSIKHMNDTADYQPVTDMSLSDIQAANDAMWNPKTEEHQSMAQDAGDAKFDPGITKILKSALKKKHASGASYMGHIAKEKIERGDPDQAGSYAKAAAHYGHKAMSNSLKKLED